MRPSDVPVELLQKYAGRGPRYTSYPTAPVWKGPFDGDILLDAVSDLGSDARLSLYQHIPFCRHRCAFCACNVIITPLVDIAREYVALLIREMELVSSRLKKDASVTQWHLGGGTPTFLPSDELDRLLSNTETIFQFESAAEKSIEVDSRVTTPEHLQVLRSHGFNRISMGVQDFDEATQKLIGRKQSFGETQDFVQQCRDAGFESVAIDLVYGLPGQNRNTTHKTLEKIIEIRPDRIAYYSYAHLPAKMPNQRKIDGDLVPDSEERWRIFTSGSDQLTSNGYMTVGMDHFALPDDELVKAQHTHTLQRNFMGFTTRAGSELLAFGTTAISGLTHVYTQNTKKLNTYRDHIRAGQLPIERGWRLTEDDRIRRWVITELLCRFEVSFSNFKSLWGRDFRDYFVEDLNGLEPFIEDGLAVMDDTSLRAIGAGQVLIRPLAMLFDAYLKTGNQTLFSKTI